MDGLGGSFHVYLYLSVALLWGDHAEREACWSGPAVGGSVFFLFFFLFFIFFFKEIHRGFFFQILSAFNFENPINLMCIAQRKEGRVGGLSNR